MSFATVVCCLHGQTVDKPLAIGNGVSAPTIVFQADPEFSLAHVKKSKALSCDVHFVVDQDGLPQRITVKAATDKKLEEPCLKAAKQDRFRPAVKDGKPVAVELNMTITEDRF